VGNEVGPSNEMTDAGEIVLQSRFLRRDGSIVEILHYDQPGHQGSRARRPMNQLGVTHLSLLVDDVDAVAAAIREYGGTVLEHTRSKRKDAEGRDQDFLFCTDPDGLRIELMYLPGAGWDEQLAQSRRR
jgi:catechol 2,3-dioxygenase-like lactoylglutathione lyase family enzyme